MKPADKRIVSLAELRFKPANSNDAARAVLTHHFADVPRCSFARDDAMSHYLGSETGIDTFPTVPDDTRATGDTAPDIREEAPPTSGNLPRKLMRGGFALSVFLHAAVAFAIGYTTTLALPDADSLMEGVTSVSIVVEGNSEADEAAAGDVEDTEKPEETPLAEADLKPVEKQLPKPVETVAEAKPEEILKDIPLPALGADLPEILATRQPSEAKAEIAVEPAPVEEKVEEDVKPVLRAAQPLPHPISKPRALQKAVEKAAEEKPKPVEKKPEARKEDPKKPEKKDKPQEKRRTNKGNQGNAANNAKRGDVDAAEKGKTASENSRGASANREIGNAARTNYLGMVQKRLNRAKGRMRAPGKGKVTVNFTITPNGSITGLRISASSGKEAVDAAALKVVRSAAPFPALPAEAGWKSRAMRVPMTFK